MDWCRGLLIASVALAFPAPVESQQSDLQVCGDLDRRDWDAKIAACTRALQQKAARPEYLRNARGLWYHKKGDYDRAIADFTEALRLEPAGKGRATIYSNRGNSLNEKGEFERALEDHEQAVRADPSNPMGFVNKAYTLQEMGQLDRALIDYAQAIKLAPNLPHSYGGRGHIYRAKGDLDAALADYNHVLRIDPKSVQGYASRGLVYEARGDLERARQDFKTASGLPLQLVVDRKKKYVGIDIERHQNTARMRLKVLSDVQKVPSVEPIAHRVGRRIALVIGNSRYASAGALRNPSNDARVVAGTLRKMGFEVTESIDLNGVSMRTVMRDFLLASTGAQVAVLFYAGHGLQIDGRNYLVPIDAEIGDKDGIETNLAQLDNILAGLDDQIRTNVVILDACRDNPLAQEITRQVGTSRSIVVRGGLAPLAGPGKGATSGAGTLIAFATAPGQVALDGDGDNSPFSAALTRHLSTPGLEVQQMLTRVRAEVVAATNGKQVPWSNSSLLGEVYLLGKP